jgi:hypothetical protein
LKSNTARLRSQSFDLFRWQKNPAAAEEGRKTGTFTISAGSRLRFRKNCVNISEGAAKVVELSLLKLPANRGEALTVTNFQAVCHRSI